MDDKLIGVIGYDSADWLWVSNHHDVHLTGLLLFDGQLCRFETDYESELVSVYALDLKQKAGWIFRKKLFELCVGRHLSYPARLQGAEFCWRYPRWLHKQLFELYYKVTKWILI